MVILMALSGTAVPRSPVTADVLDGIGSVSFRNQVTGPVG